MSVDSFDPAAMNAAIDPALVTDLLQVEFTAEDALALSDAQITMYAPLVSHAQWAEVAPDWGDAELHKLARIFTVGETQYPSWAAGDKSAVVPIVKVLKGRGQFSAEHKRWIKAHTDNRFLPYGNLMDRL